MLEWIYIDGWPVGGRALHPVGRDEYESEGNHHSDGDCEESTPLRMINLQKLHCLWFQKSNALAIWRYPTEIRERLRRC